MDPTSASGLKLKERMIHRAGGLNRFDLTHEAGSHSPIVQRSLKAWSVYAEIVSNVVKIVLNLPSGVGQRTQLATLRLFANLRLEMR